MGFEIGGSTAVLEFDEGTVLAGAKVRVSLEMSVREVLAFQREMARVQALSESDIEDAVEAAERHFRRFATSSLRSWDLVRDGQPVPADEDGFLSLPFTMANAIVGAWMQAMTGVSPNSPAASVNGATAAAT